MFKYGSKLFYHHTNRRFFTSKMIRIKELNLEYVDIRKSFNINKDTLVYKNKEVLDDQLLIYKTNYRHLARYGILTIIVAGLTGYFFYDLLIKKTKKKYINGLTLIYLVGLYILFSFMLKSVRKIEVTSLKNNKVRIYLLLKSIETDFETLKVSDGDKLYIKDNMYYMGNRKVFINANEDLAKAIMKGYKIKFI
jgi:hypothetical protein